MIHSEHILFILSCSLVEMLASNSCMHVFPLSCFYYCCCFIGTSMYYIDRSLSHSLFIGKPEFVCFAHVMCSVCT